MCDTYNVCDHLSNQWRILIVNVNNIEVKRTYIYIYLMFLFRVNNTKVAFLDQKINANAYLTMVSGLCVASTSYIPSELSI